MAERRARQETEHRIVNALIDAERPLRKADILDVTGLSPPAVRAALRQLVESHVVLEASGDRHSRRGRTADVYRPNGGLIGVDLGGTTLRTALADVYGNIVAARAQTTPVDAAGCCDVIQQSIEEMNDEVGDAVGPIRTACVGLAGNLNRKEGVVTRSYNVPFLAEVASLKGAFTSCLDVPENRVQFFNDASMAAYGEVHRGGHGPLSLDLFGFFVGTGVGLGRVMSGVVDEGAHGLAWESDNVPLKDFEHAGLEGLCSGRSIESRYVHERSETDQVVLRATEIFRLAKNGDDATAVRLLRDAASAMASAMQFVQALVDPSLLVLGGGVGSSSIFREAVLSDLETRGWDEQRLPVVTGRLGDQNGIHGAIAMARKALPAALIASF